MVFKTKAKEQKLDGYGYTLVLFTSLFTFLLSLFLIFFFLSRMLLYYISYINCLLVIFSKRNPFWRQYYAVPCFLLVIVFYLLLFLNFSLDFVHQHLSFFRIRRNSMIVIDRNSTIAKCQAKYQCMNDLILNKIFFMDFDKIVIFLFLYFLGNRNFIRLRRIFRWEWGIDSMNGIGWGIKKVD